MEILIGLVVVVALVFGVKRYLSSTKKKVIPTDPVEVPDGIVIPDLVTIPEQPIPVDPTAKP